MLLVMDLLMLTTALMSLVTPVKCFSSWDTTPKSNNSSTLIERLTSWDTTPKSNNSSTLIERLTSWDTTPKSNNSSTLIKRLTSLDTTPKSNNSSTLIKRLTQSVNKDVEEKFDSHHNRDFKSNLNFRTNFDEDKITKTMMANNNKKGHDYFNPTFYPENTFKCPPCVCKNINSSSVSVICTECSIKSIPKNWPLELDALSIEYCYRLKVLDLMTLLMYPSLKRVIITMTSLVNVFSSRRSNVSSKMIDLDLGHNNISKVEDNCFLFLPNLLNLSLSNNKLENLTKKMFTGLRSLQYLSVAVNKINFIANDTFYDMGTLVTLDISVNRIIYTDYDLLPVGIFIPLRNLEQLYINDMCNRLKYQCGSYPNKALQALTNLKLLSIDGADSRSLGAEIQSLKHLRNLIITQPKSLDVCNESYFDNVPFITSLNFYILKPRLPPKAFNKLKNLVNLTYSRIIGNIDICKYLTNNKYFKSPFLKYLTLSRFNSLFDGCRQLYAQHAVYLKLFNLIELDLSFNYLMYMSPDFIKMLPKTLKKIDLSGNQLFGELFFSLYNFPEELLEINLNDQNKHHYAQQNKKGINKQRISKNEVRSKESDFLTLNRQEYSFDDSTLEIKEASKCFLPPKLEVLRADNFKKFGNNILKMPDTSNCSLKKLSLAGGEIHDWSFWLFFNTLEVADFSNNNALNTSFLPENNSIKYLSMSNNLFGPYFRYDAKGLYFKNMKQLIALDISKNSIKVIAKNCFRHLVKLQILDTSENKFQTINISFSKMTEIRYLDFSGNAITSICKKSRDDLDLIAADHRVYLDLTSNPLPCTCDGLELMKWMAFTNVYLLNKDFLECRNEFNEILEIGNLVQRVETLQRQCASKTVIILTCLFSIIVFVILLIASLMYRYRWNLRYLRSLALVKLLGARRAANNMIGYRFDAYILYTDDTRRFVLRDCVRELEEKRGHRLCIEDRDFLPGNFNVSQIVSGVQNSTKTVAMVTPEFYEGEYSEYSVKMALMEEIFMRRSVLFLCVCEPTDDEDLSYDLLTAMKQNNYIEYPPRDDVTDEIIEEFWNQFSRAIGRNEREEI